MARKGGIALFVALLAGLPVAVELTDGNDQGWSAALQARTSNAIAIATPVRISEHLALTLDRGLVSLSGRASSESDSARMVVVEEASLTLDLATPPPDAPAAGPEPHAFRIPNIGGFSAGALKLRRATFTVVGPSRDAMTIRDVNATVIQNRKGSHKLVGTGHFNGERLSFDAAWSDAAPRGGVPQAPFRLSLRSTHIEASLDGLVSSSRAPAFEGRAEFRMPSLRRFVRWSGLGAGVGDHLRSIVISGPLNWNTGRMAFSRAMIGIDGNQATGALTLQHGPKRVSIDGTLAFEELDLGRYWLSRPQPEAPGAPQDGTPFLAMFDADLRLSAGKIRTPALEIGRGAATLSLTNGRLQADLAGLEVENGTADGLLKLDVNHPVPRAEIKLKVKAVDGGRLLAAAALRPNSLLGRSNVTFDGTAEGRSLGEAVSTLAGRGLLELTEPGRLGLDLPALIYAARGAPTVSWAAAGRGTTPLDALTCRFRVLNGALSIETLQARSGGATIIGAGRLDVPGRLMDLSIVSGPTAQGEAPVTAQDVLALRGTWDNPTISFVKPPQRPAIKAEVPIRSY